jgi:pyridoxamine 5'-phosphate oxidase
MSLFARLFSARGLLLGFHEADADPDPIRQFQSWFRFAGRVLVPMPNACTLATATPEGQPSARMVLLKGVEAAGFVFFTNYESRKGEEIERNPRAVLVFCWTELFRQVRVEGGLEKVSAEESDAYFRSRTRGSRIGAWASRQSTVLSGRAELESRVREFEARYPGDQVPRPPHWGGYRLMPERIEFWQGRPSRLHDRLCYTRNGGIWNRVRLSP